MSNRAMKIVRRILWLDGGLLFLFIVILASPAVAQTLADALNASGLAATRAAEVASSTDGVLKLALWAVILLVMLLSATIAYLLKTMTQMRQDPLMERIACALDRLSSRPCVLSREGLEEHLRRERAVSLLNTPQP